MTIAQPSPTVHRLGLIHKKPILLEETPETLAALLTTDHFPAFRTDQIFNWIYKKFIQKPADMANLPSGLISWLDERFMLNPLQLVRIQAANDITQKYLFKLQDGALIETVFIRYPQQGVGAEASRKTICVSSQVGCAYGCKFCASGLDGWKRHLSAAEIIAQILYICHEEQKTNPGCTPFDNIVFMGMGEPLANYKAVLKAIQALNAPWGLHFGGRRITISTSGLAPEIIQLADEPVSFRLAISLHGATNAVRSQIMPVNKKYPLEILIPAIQAFSQKRGRMITLEYILIQEVNDLLSEAQELVKIAKKLHAHVNLIPYNTVEGLPWKRPNIMRQKAFHDVLKQAGVSATIRKEKGHDIAAACGQLRMQVLREATTA